MSAPIILRPIAENDHAALARLVGSIADGLTSLPNDPDFLQHKIDDSLRGFDPRVRKPNGESYLFVLEDTANHTLAGTSGLLSRVGGFEPFYTYTIESHKQSYPPLHIALEHDSLNLTKSHKGPTEICSLFLHPDYRRGGLGRLLSLARFCFIKAFPDRFAANIIAELRGFIDADGKSPFWEAVGVKFFEHDYYTADILSGLGNKDFIEALMPRHPIYINLLPFSAQKVIGKVHPHTEPALQMLLTEGFERTNQVDIFDAGPLLRAQRERLRIWSNIHTATAQPLHAAAKPEQPRALVTNRQLDFRALLTTIDVAEPDAISLPSAALDALQLASDNKVDYVLLD
jgi:arginine N-succinyltransferase